MSVMKIIFKLPSAAKYYANLKQKSPKVNL